MTRRALREISEIARKLAETSRENYMLVAQGVAFGARWGPRGLADCVVGEMSEGDGGVAMHLVSWNAKGKRPNRLVRRNLFNLLARAVSDIRATVSRARW